MKSKFSLLLFIALFSSGVFANEANTQLSDDVKQKIEEAKIKAEEMLDEANQKSSEMMQEFSDKSKGVTEKTLQQLDQKSEQLQSEAQKKADEYSHQAAEHYLYIKELFNESFQKGQSESSDAMIYGTIRYKLLMAPGIQSTKIKVEVKNSEVELSGTVLSEQQAEQIISLSIDTKGVSKVSVNFVIEKKLKNFFKSISLNTISPSKQFIVLF